MEMGGCALSLGRVLGVLGLMIWTGMRQVAGWDGGLNRGEWGEGYCLGCVAQQWVTPGASEGPVLG